MGARPRWIVVCYYFAMSSAEAGFEGFEPVSPAPGTVELRLVHSEASPPADVLTEYQSTLVVDHLYLVDGAVRWAQHHRGRRLDVEEAYGDGSFGLCDAARRYNPTLQVAFPSYATPRIRGAIIDGERRLHGLAGKERRSARVVSLFNSTRARSLDEPMPGGAGSFLTLLEVLPSGDETDEDAAQRIATERFYEGLSLTERQKTVTFLKARKYTLKEIGAVLGISERTVSRDYRQAAALVIAAYHPHLFD